MIIPKNTEFTTNCINGEIYIFNMLDSQNRFEKDMRQSVIILLHDYNIRVTPVCSDLSSYENNTK